MRIGLIDVDSHNFPNLPLMKISAYHKNKGDDVDFVESCGVYDLVYMSKVFTESAEPEIDFLYEDLIQGGSGYDLKNKLPDEIEYVMPDYDLYPQYDFALGFLTRGCPRVNHTFCITPEKDGRCVRKVADLSQFWKGQKEIVLLDQNLLACKEKYDLLEQLAACGSRIVFNGGTDIRFLDEKVVDIMRHINTLDYHFAWDDPKEDLKGQFKLFADSGIMNKAGMGVYVLTNYWSTIEEDLYRIYTLRSMGYMPFVMIYDKQRFVDKRGRWLKGVEKVYSRDELIHFKTCQHMQRWCNNRAIVKSEPDFEKYTYYKKWKLNGMKVPTI